MRIITQLHVFVYLLLIGLCACTDGSANLENNSLSTLEIIPGLASPIHADIDVTVIEVADYLASDILLDSVSLFGELQEFNESEIHIHNWTSDDALGALQLWHRGEAHVIPVYRSRKARHTFEFDPRGKEFEQVHIKGEMNAWNPELLVMDTATGRYVTTMVLEPRVYQYIMLLDGEEKLDVNNSVSVDNGMGGYNNVLNNGAKLIESLSLTAHVELGQLELSASRPSKYLVLWNNQEIVVNEKGSNVSLRLPTTAKREDRSHLRIWAYDENGVSNDLLIPLNKGHVIENTGALDRHDKHAMILYNVFVDRFENGDTKNDGPIASSEVHPRADDHGGDLRGIIDRLEAGYFDSLSINTIWISPIVKNVEGAWGAWPSPETKFSAYHGYWPVSFTQIDNRKGTDAELHELVGKAHDRGINVLLDFVANHVHEQHPYYLDHPEHATELYLPDGRLNTELWDEQRLTTWFDVFLPTLKLDEPAVYEMLTDSAVYWIEEYQLDGFRHDATKHVPAVFWKTLTRKLKDRVSPERPIYQIGETYGTADLIASYVNSGQLDAQFDFNVYDAIVASVCQNSIGFDRLDNEVQASLDNYGHHHLMGNITGNQDRGRFVSYAGGALRFDENAKEAGWSRTVGVGDSTAYAKTSILMAITAMLPGLPVIYYGDEVGSYGGNDPDNRKMMQFDSLNVQQAALKAETEELMKIRRESMPLIYGDYRAHLVKDETYVFSRNYLGRSVYILVNTSSAEQTLTFSLDKDQGLSWGRGLRGIPIRKTEDKKLQLQLQPYSYEILF